MNTKIRNIVFYKFKENGVEKTQACIFYENGEIVNTDYEGGIEACEEVVKERKITSSDAFREMINNEIVHCVSDDEFVANFETYKAPSIKKAIEEEVAKTMEKVVVKTTPKEEKEVVKVAEEAKKEEIKEYNAPLDDTAEIDRINVYEEYMKKEKAEKAEKGLKGWFKRATSKIKKSRIGQKITSLFLTASLVTNPLGGLFSCSNRNTLEGMMASSNIAYAQGFEEDELTNTETISDTTYTDYNVSDLSYSYEENSSSYDSSVEYSASSSYEETGYTDYVEEYSATGDTSVEYVEEGTVETGYETGNAAGYTYDGGYTAGGSYVSTQVTNGGSNQGSCQQTQKKDCHCQETKCAEKTKVEKGNNETYGECNFKELLELTTNKFQKQTMFKLANALKDYNVRFAKAYVEEGKDIQASLTFEEMVALQQAYNNFTDEEIRAYFNGTLVNSSSIAAAYKDASSQLMGAYIIEDSENALDMSTLIETEEGKEFYHRYHKMFLAIKDSKSEAEKEARLEAFYQCVRQDFNFEKTEVLEGYKLSVAPMIAAVEMMYQDFEIDFKLTENEIEFLKDIGLTKYANKIFARVENATKNCKMDKANPTYSQYRKAIIKMLNGKCNEKSKCTCNCKGKCTCGKNKCETNNSKRGNCGTQRTQSTQSTYVVNNCQRDLAQLQRYQQRVNWRYYEHVNENWREYYTVHCPQVWKVVWEEMCKYQESIHEEEYKMTEKIAWTETETEYREVIEKVEKEIPEEWKAVIDEQIECENERAREEAYRESERVREELQRTEDEKAEQIAEEIRQEEEDLQENIANANEQIERNQDGDPTNDRPVNERDLGAGVKFDEEDSDEFGNLDNSVENLTTDPTGNQEGQPLPDPNETGRRFDEEGNYLPVEDVNYDEYEIIEDNTNGNDNTSDNTTDEQTGYDEFEYNGDNTDYDNNSNNQDNNTSTDNYYVDDAPTDYDSVEEIDDSYFDDNSNQETFDTNTNDYVDNGNDGFVNNGNDGFVDNSYDGNDNSEENGNGYVEYVSDGGDAYIEYPEGYTPYVEPTVSNEEVVNNYVESMASNPIEEAGMAYSYGM